MKKKVLNPSYIGKRDDIVALIPPNAKFILDIGCSTGILGEQIKQFNKNTIIHGIELDSEMADIAKSKLNKVMVGDVEKEISNILNSSQKYDCIIFADILEHLYDPWSIVKKIKGILSENGVIIASIPNIIYYNTFINLLIKKHWPYEDRGIHDKTHLRFFTKSNIIEMFENADLRIKNIKRNYRLIDKHTKLNKISKFLGIPLVKEFFTFQYIVVVCLKNS